MDEANAGRRVHRRAPFFRPAKIASVFGRAIQGFVREISRDGVGLVHAAPVEPGDYTLAIFTAKNQQIDVNVRLTWCRAICKQWHLSGGVLRELSFSQSALLRLHTTLSGSKQRLTQRYPFFQPVSLTACDANRTVFEACTRDISDAGVGLLHTFFLEPQRVVLTIPRRGNPLFELTTEITWCAPCGEAFISGGHFQSLVHEELPMRLL